MSSFIKSNGSNFDGNNLPLRIDFSEVMPDEVKGVSIDSDELADSKVEEEVFKDNAYI